MVFVVLEENKPHPDLPLREKPQSGCRAQISSPLAAGRAGSKSLSLGMEDLLLVPKSTAAAALGTSRPLERFQAAIAH